MKSLLRRMTKMRRRRKKRRRMKLRKMLQRMSCEISNPEM